MTKTLVATHPNTYQNKTLIYSPAVSGSKGHRLYLASWTSSLVVSWVLAVWLNLSFRSDGIVLVLVGSEQQLHLHINSWIEQMLYYFNLINNHNSAKFWTKCAPVEHGYLIFNPTHTDTLNVVCSSNASMVLTCLKSSQAINTTMFNLVKESL